MFVCVCVCVLARMLVQPMSGRNGKTQCGPFKLLHQGLGRLLPLTVTVLPCSRQALRRECLLGFRYASMTPTPTISFPISELSRAPSLSTASIAETLLHTTQTGSVQWLLRTAVLVNILSNMGFAGMNFIKGALVSARASFRMGSSVLRCFA